MNRIEWIFGKGLGEFSADEAAIRSSRRFVRSRSQLGVFEESRNPSGHVLTAWEAYKAYGLAVLEEAIEYSAAILIHCGGCVENTLRGRREELGLELGSVARAAKLSRRELEKAETPNADNSLRNLERIGFVLGLDELRLGHREQGGGDAELAVRLKTLQAERSATLAQNLSSGAALTFAEAASIIRVQTKLQSWLGIEMGGQNVSPIDDYGHPGFPAWQVGYRLAEQARTALNLGQAPIESMRDLVEGTLGIPVIQARMPNPIAGATISVREENHAEVRGIVLNTVGENRNVWVRRATLAHELGHLLYDPMQRLEHLRVDSYLSNEQDPQTSAADYVEQRANAFAIAFLAPLDAVRNTVPTPVRADSIAEIMRTFGISHTAARYHVVNAHYRNYDAPSEIVDVQPSDEQQAAENFSLDYFPIANTPDQRRGRFSDLVATAHQRGFISEQSAAAYLSCSVEEFLENGSALVGLHRK